MTINPFDLKSALLAKHAQHVVLVHFPIALSIAAAGAAIVSLIGQAHDARAPAETAWLLAGAVALGLLALIVTVFFLSNPSLEIQAKELFIPFFKEPIINNLGWFTLIFFAFVIVGCSNAVNLTDGLDGLAAGCTVTAASTYAILAYAAGNVAVATYLDLPYYRQSSELTVVCTALAGAGLGFLWFNCHPARIFMGDTGSLSIGSTLGVVSICCKQELLLAVVGGVFVIEAVSVILQVLSFKTRGKRVLLMAPLHHHFELKGWKENTVIVRFWIMSLMFALLGLATLKLR